MNKNSSWRARGLAGCASLLALGLLLPGCGRKKTAPATNRLDLSQAVGIFNAMPGTQTNPAAVAVTVNGKQITYGDIQSEMQKARTRTGDFLPAQQAANNLILRTLLLMAAEKEKISVPGQDLAAAIETIRKQLPTNTTLEAAIKTSGITEQEFRHDVLTELQITRLIERRVQSIPNATDAELNQLVKDNPRVLQVPELVTVRHILVATPPGGNPATAKTQQARAEKIRQQLLQGGKFETVAAAMSDDPDKARGGLLPPLARGQITDKVFEAAAFSQKAGELGPVIQTQRGYEILQVQDRRATQSLKFDDVKERLRQAVTQQKRQKALQDYVNSLRSQAKVVLAQQPGP